MTNGELPVFNGYTVDTRLREFRKMNFGELPEFISFDSPKGKRLLELYKRSQRIVKGGSQTDAGYIKALFNGSVND